MRVLFVTSRLPYPPFRGDKLKMWNLIRRVAKVHEVVLLSLVQSAVEESYKHHLAPYCTRIELVRLPMLRSLWECAKNVPQRTPFQVAFFRSREMGRRLNRIVREWKPDLIHTHLIRLAPYTVGASEIPRVLDMTDAVSLYLLRFLETERNLVKRMLLTWEYRRMVAFESIVAQFDRALVCSEIDREALLRNVPSASISLLFNGVDTEIFKKVAVDETDPSRIIFTGNMTYFPNADGAQFFAKDIFPLVKKSVPEAKLYIVGQNPPRSVRRLAEDDIVVTGFVQDIRAEYARSAVAVSPIRFGAGTLNKVLEPLTMGIPVVATSHGVAGLHLRAGTDILVTDDPVEFAEHVIRLLRQPALREQIGSSATQRIRSAYSWETIGATLLSMYEEIMKTHGDKKKLRAQEP